MTRAAKWVLLLGVVVASAIGFVPRFAAKGTLDQDARDAATAAIQSPDGRAAAEASAARHHGIRLISVSDGTSAVTGLPTATVTLQETVHSFLDGFPGLRTWFRISSTQTVGG